MFGRFHSCKGEAIEHHARFDRVSLSEMRDLLDTTDRYKSSLYHKGPKRIAEST